MKTLSSWMAATLLTLFAGAAPAHHSGAMFDTEKDQVVDGVIREMQWTSPHCWLLVVANDPAETLWSFEGPPPSMMTRLGMRRSDFPTGEKVTVHGRPIKDGQPVALFVSLTRADGNVVKAAAPK
jgi:hypothetical protein